MSDEKIASGDSGNNVSLDEGQPRKRAAGARDGQGEFDGSVAAVQPPLTDRGVVSALDYFKVTVWDRYENAVDHIYHSGLQSFLTDSADGFIDYDFSGYRIFQIKKWLNQLFIIGYADNNGICNYYSVELKGEGCSKVGLSAIQGFLSYLRGKGIKFRCSRLDIAFDYCPFSPRHIRAAARRGNVNSRVFDVDTLKWYHDHGQGQGRTCYLGDRRGAYFLRCYDRRGYTRLEFELKDTAAEKYALELLRVPAERFTPCAVSWVRGMIDFIDRAGRSRDFNRCGLLPWWSKFVSDAAKVKVANVQRDTWPWPETYKLERAIKCMAPLAKVLINEIGLEQFPKLLDMFLPSNPERFDELSRLVQSNLMFVVPELATCRYSELPF